MAIFLTILKWLGIILLFLLVMGLIGLLLVLLVPFRYKAAARVDDPETHSEFPVAVLRNRSEVTAQVTWLFGAVRLLVSYPNGELISLKVFGRDMRIMERLKRKAPQEEKEPEEEKGEEEKEEERKSLSERAEEAMDTLERIFDTIDYIWRVLTGSCGRRALSKIGKRIQNIMRHTLPERYLLSGTVGLSDPCLNGRMTGACAVLMPVCDDSLQIATQWEDYRCDLKAEVEGKMRVGVPVKEAVPLVFDKDCRKLYKKLLRARSKLVKNTATIQQPITSDQIRRAEKEE